MTPTLLGRWETRIFLLGFFGGLISLLASLILSNFRQPLTPIPFIVLGYVILFGLAWDAIYQNIIYFRWDRDWPTIFQVLAGIAEGALVWFLAYANLLPGVPAQSLPLHVFLLHYGSIWLVTFIIAQGPLRTVLVRWRYRGGEWF